MKNILSIVRIGVFLTWDYSLKTWENSGVLEREIQIFKQLHEKKGVEFTFFTYGSSSDLRYFERYQFVEVVPIYSSINPPKSRVLRFLYSLIIPIVHRNKLGEVDILYQNQLLGSWVPIIAKYLLKKPLMIRTGYDMLDFSVYEQKSKFIIFLYKVLTFISVKTSDKYTLTNKVDVNRFKKNFPKDRHKFLLRPNWVEHIESQRIDLREKKRILTVGRVVKQKNFHFLISEFSNIKGEFIIDIVGSGEQEDFLVNFAAKNSVKVNFLGNLKHSELINLYKKYKFFISTSIFEGNPKTIIEAMAAGCVVLASNISNHTEIIQHLENGLLFPLEKNELKTTFEELIKNKDLSDISNNAVQKVRKENSLDSLVYKTYDDVCSLKVSHSR